MSAIYAWLRRHPRLVDAVPALFLILPGIGGPFHWWLRLPLAAMMAVPLVFRRRNPLAAFGVAAVGGAIQVVTGTGPTGSDLAILILLYTVAAYRPRRESVVALIICLVGSVLAVNLWPTLATLNSVHRLIVGTVAFGGLALAAWILGDSMRYRRAYYVALEDRAARLEAERDAQAKIAAAAERARIARELHDVIAHNVSVMVVQADGAWYVVRSDPERAAAAISAISRTGRQALTEMRRLLGLLRSGDESATLAPVPGLAQLRELLDEARTAGLSVSFMLQGVPRPLPEGAELAAYRVVQESLTNTRKHGGLAAAAAVTLRFETDDLVVQVTDDGLGASAAADGAGHGLTGMRERIELYGGTIQAGPLPTGGYRVTARLPCPLQPHPQQPRAAQLPPQPPPVPAHDRQPVQPVGRPEPPAQPNRGPEARQVGQQAHQAGQQTHQAGLQARDAGQQAESGSMSGAA